MKGRLFKGASCDEQREKVEEMRGMGKGEKKKA